MKLSSSTVDVLKNFANINENILIKEGCKLRTMSTMKNILAEADVSESFETEFGIYDLNEFLNVLDLTDQPELEFNNESFLVINGGSAQIKYFYSDPSILVTPPDVFNPPEGDVKFEMSRKVLTKVLKAASIMQLEDIVFTRDKITATDVKNVTSNNFSELLKNVEGDSFNFAFKAENLKVIPGDYDVSISSTQLISSWINKSKQVKYWIALEDPSD